MCAEFVLQMKGLVQHMSNANSNLFFGAGIKNKKNRFPENRRDKSPNYGKVRLKLCTTAFNVF